MNPSIRTKKQSRQFCIAVIGAIFALCAIAFSIGLSHFRALDSKLNVTNGAPPLKSHIPYASTFLDSTSMWAMGTDARTIPPRRKFVSLVSWMTKRWRASTLNDDACSGQRRAIDPFTSTHICGASPRK